MCEEKSLQERFYELLNAPKKTGEVLPTAHCEIIKATADEKIIFFTSNGSFFVYKVDFVNGGYKKMLDNSLYINALEEFCDIIIDEYTHKSSPLQ
jgi:hypothetical protein